MPSVSEKQARFMAAAAHNPQFAQEAGIPRSVAQEFHQADAGKKYGAKPGHRRVAAALTAKQPKRGGY